MPKFTILHKEKKIAVEKGKRMPRKGLFYRLKHILFAFIIRNKKRKE